MLVQRCYPFVRDLHLLKQYGPASNSVGKLIKAVEPAVPLR